MGLESLQQKQTPTSFMLRCHSHLPFGTASVLLGLLLLVGTPFFVFGWVSLHYLKGWMAELCGSSFIAIGLFPPLSISFMMLDSWVESEDCIFDKAIGQVIFKQREGLFSAHSSRYLLREVVDVEVLEDIKLGSHDEIYSVYQVAIRLQSGKQLPLTSQSSYYEEIPQKIAADLRQFLELPGEFNVANASHQQMVVRDEG
jgi:hypothetical protein